MTSSSKLLGLTVAGRESLGIAHTLPEILQQPQTWKQTYQKVLSLAQPAENFLTASGLRPNNQASPDVLLVGAGTSDYIGKSVCGLLQKLWRCNVQPVPSTELLTNMEDHVIAGRDYLWISFSRSGDSSEGVAVLEEAKGLYPRIKHIIVTCNQKGRMARSFEGNKDVFTFVLDDAVNDRGLAMTSSFSNMVVVAQALAHFRSFADYGPIVETLASSASSLLPVAMDVCEGLVNEGFSKVCFLGSGALKGAAIESGLKVLELTGGRVTTLTESFLGLRHGPLSALDKQTLVVAFLSADARRRSFEVDLLREIHDKKLTSKCLTVVPTVAGAEPGNWGQASISLDLAEGISDLYLPPLVVMVGQLLGLLASLREGLRPDEPSPEGAISRVVSHVKIY